MTQQIEKIDDPPVRESPIDRALPGWPMPKIWQTWVRAVKALLASRFGSADQSAGDWAVLSNDQRLAGAEVGGTLRTLAEVTLAGDLRIDLTIAGTAGAATGTYAVVNINGTRYKIALLAD
jgi:hypothetical protein